MIQAAEDDREYLGEEFLTWLWYRVERDGGVFTLEDLGSVGIAFDRSLELRDGEGTGRVHVSCDAVTYAPEAHAALACGKRVCKARLVVGLEDDNFELTLSGGTLDVGSLKFSPITADDAFELEIERLERLWTASAIVSGLYEMFLKDRLSPKFETETLDDIRSWIERRARRFKSRVPNGKEREAATTGADSR